MWKINKKHIKKWKEPKKVTPKTLKKLTFLELHVYTEDQKLHNRTTQNCTIKMPKNAQYILKK